jgi:hypothetical protein
MRKLFLPLIFIAAISPFALRTTALSQSLLVAKSASLSGRTVATIQGQDLVHPTLSPDGKFLAYSEVILENKRENTAVRILQLETKQSFVLISPKEAAKYRTFGSFVSNMHWRQADRLEITISDGDVNFVILTFDPLRRKLLSTHDGEAGEESPVMKKLRQRIHQQFPKIPQVTLEKISIESSRSSQRLETKEAAILSGELLDRERNLWLIDFKHRSLKRLFEAKDPLAKARIESATVTNNGTFVLLLITNDERRFLIVYKDGLVQKKQAITTEKGSMKIIHAAHDRILIMNYVFNPYEEGDNPLYIWENGKLRKSTEYDRLYDAQVNSRGTRIAYCYWSNGKRHIAVKELI